jgi:hypothetical protein
MRSAWFLALISAMCLEGLGRRYLPVVPAPVFYFLKDVVLLFGYWRFKPQAQIVGTARSLFRGFEAAWVAALLWTVAEVFNPDSQSIALALIGLRSYWLWWLAPIVVASVMQGRKEKERAIYSLVVLAIGVSALAAVQFAAPANSSLNMYSVWNGEEVYASDVATVPTTGRARVASTFAYVSGFAAFTLLVPTLLLSLGLDAENPRVRRAALLGTLATAAVVPMSGSRSSVVLGIAVLLVALWTAGLFFTRTGRRLIVGSIVAVVLAVVAFPEALVGVESRFENRSETAGRFEEVAYAFPLVPMIKFDYPAIGVGTGMQQNAKALFGITTNWEVEAEAGRYLVELGPIGYLLVWTARLGLLVALLRSYSILKRAGRRGSAGAALCYAALTMLGNLTFDHNWQSLYFMGCGFVLAEVVAVRRAALLARAAASPTATVEAAPERRVALARSPGPG